MKVTERGKCFTYYKGEPVPKWFAKPSRSGPHWPLTWLRDVEVLYLQSEGVEIWPLKAMTTFDLKSTKESIFWVVDGPDKITTRYTTHVHPTPRTLH